MTEVLRMAFVDYKVQSASLTINPSAKDRRREGSKLSVEIFSIRMMKLISTDAFLLC